MSSGERRDLATFQQQWRFGHGGTIGIAVEADRMGSGDWEDLGDVLAAVEEFVRTHPQVREDSDEQ